MKEVARNIYSFAARALQQYPTQEYETSAGYEGWRIWQMWIKWTILPSYLFTPGNEAVWDTELKQTLHWRLALDYHKTHETPIKECFCDGPLHTTAHVISTGDK